MNEPNRTAWHRFVAYCSRERFLTGAALFRAIAGATILYQYLINYDQRRFLFGPDGVFPFDAFVADHKSGFSLYALSRSTTAFETIYHLGIVAAVLFMIGWRTRLMTALNYVFWMSLHRRFPGLWDGGDNLMQLTLVYALFADLGARWSFDSERRSSHPDVVRLRAISHNFAMLAIAIQISLVYGIAGLTKVQGETWRNGTALYYALRAGQFTLPGWSEHIYHNGVLLTVLAYATVAFQVSFPFLLLINRWTRVAAVLAGLTFHLGIAFFMGLITFAAFLIAADLSLIGDDEYRRLGEVLRRVKARAVVAVRQVLKQRSWRRPAAIPITKERS